VSLSAGTPTLPENLNPLKLLPPDARSAVIDQYLNMVPPNATSASDVVEIEITPQRQVPAEVGWDLSLRRDIGRLIESAKNQ
jgi:hypothetical protein